MELHGRQAIIVAVTALFLGITTPLVIFRLIIRRPARNYGLDDWLMIVGQIIYIAFGSTLILSATYGLGLRHVQMTVVEDEHAAHAFFAVQLLYVTALGFIKTSGCVTLFRLAKCKYVKGALWFVMILSNLTVIAAILVLFERCHPISTFWRGAKDGHCRSPVMILVLTSILTATSIMTDLALTILPSAIMFKMQMDARLRITLAIMLSFGFTAAIPTIVRIPYLQAYLWTHDRMYGLGYVGLWSMLECGFGIIAASIPTLRPLLERTISLSLRTGPLLPHRQKQWHKERHEHRQQQWQQWKEQKRHSSWDGRTLGVLPTVNGSTDSFDMLTGGFGAPSLKSDRSSMDWQKGWDNAGAVAVVEDEKMFQVGLKGLDGEII